MNTISTDKAPKALGHYSQAIESDGLVFVSGQLPLSPIDNTVPEGIKAQTKQALHNLDEVLKAANSSKNDVLKVTVFISDISLWAEMNEEYSVFFGEHKPARSAVPIKDLPRGCLVEIEAIAKSY